MSSEALAKDGKPKVFFIISNDLTSTVLGYHSNKICQTPNIDRLAAKGMGFIAMNWPKTIIRPHAPTTL